MNRVVSVVPNPMILETTPDVMDHMTRVIQSVRHEDKAQAALDRVLESATLRGELVYPGRFTPQVKSKVIQNVDGALVVSFWAGTTQVYFNDGNGPPQKYPV